MKHDTPHPMAGQTVRLGESAGTAPNGQVLAGALYRIEDWQDRVMDGSWMDALGNPAALSYARRSAMLRLPFDNEVVYGKVEGIGYIVHISEFEPVAV